MKDEPYTLLYVVVFIACCGGCTPKILVRDEAEISRSSDSLWQTNRDSIYFQDQQEKESLLNLRLQHLSLSVPDSLGKQYIEHITLMESEGIKKERGSSSFLKNNQEKTELISNNLHHQKALIKEEKQGVTAFGCWWMVCLAILIALLTFALPVIKRWCDKIVSK